MTRRLFYLDLLKGFAMIGVLLTHFCQLVGSPNWGISLMASIGSRCPQLFFLVSSFLTWASFEKSSFVKGGNIMEFYKKKFSRLAPLYYVCLFFASVFPVMKLANWNMLDIVSHLTFTNGLFPEYINKWNVEWYIADLALFYVMAPFLYKIAGNLKKSLLTLAVVTLINIAFTIITNILFSTQIALNAQYEMFFHTFCIINQLPVLLMGVVLYYFQKGVLNSEIKVRKIIVCMSIVLGVVLFLFFTFHLNKRVLTSSFVAGLLFSFPFALLSSHKQEHNLRRFPNLAKFICFMGKHSYGIYCFHYIIIRFFVEKTFFFSNISNFFLWILAFVCVLVFSCFSGAIGEKYIKA